MLSYDILFDIGTMWPFYMLFAIWGIQIQLLLTAVAYEGFKTVRVHDFTQALTKVREFLQPLDESQIAAT